MRVKISIEQIKKLRAKTGAGISDCRAALVAAKGDFKKAFEILKEKGAEIVAKKASRATEQGLIETYVHTDGSVAAMVELQCETDFVARTDDFKNLAHEIVMQVAAMDPKDVEELLKQEYIRDGSKTVRDLVTEVITKVGENIVIRRFMRFELGQ